MCFIFTFAVVNRDRALAMHSIELNERRKKRNVKESCNEREQKKIEIWETDGHQDDRIVYIFGQSGTRIGSKAFEALCKGNGVQIQLISSFRDER